MYIQKVHKSFFKKSPCPAWSPIFDLNSLLRHQGLCSWPKLRSRVGCLNEWPTQAPLEKYTNLNWTGKRVTTKLTHPCQPWPNKDSKCHMFQEALPNFFQQTPLSCLLTSQVVLPAFEFYINWILTEYTVSDFFWTTLTEFIHV